MKIIDLANPQKPSKKEDVNYKTLNNSVDALVINQFSNNLCLKDNSPVIESQDVSDIVECGSDEKSLFKDINVKYEQYLKNENSKSDNNESFLDLEDSALEKFVSNRMEHADQLDIWESHSKEVLDHTRSKGMYFLHYLFYFKGFLCK